MQLELLPMQSIGIYPTNIYPTQAGHCQNLGLRFVSVEGIKWKEDKTERKRYSKAFAALNEGTSVELSC